MILYETHKIIFSLWGRFALFTWGFFVAIAWFFAGYLIYRQAKSRKDINVNYAMQFLLAIFIGVYVGARLLHNLGPWGHGTLYERLIGLFSPTGGWVGFGAIIGAITLSFIYARARKMSYAKYADLAAPSMILGIAIVRLGCFIAGCCHGSATSVPWAIIRDGAPIHPTQLYNSLANLAIFLVLVFLMQKKEKERKFHGYLLLSALMMHCAARFFTEFFRGDYGAGNYLFGFTTSQLIAAGIFMVSLAAFLMKKERAQRHGRASVSPTMRTYLLAGFGGLAANMGAYIFTPLPYLGAIFIFAGLAALFSGVNSMFKRNGG